MDSSSKKKLIIGIVVAVLIASFIIPMSYWSGSITSGRYVSEGVIVDKDSSANTIIVRLYNMTSNNDKIETSTFVELKGDIPNDAYLGQNVMIGYSKKGLYEDTRQKVEMSFDTSGNLMTGLILPTIMPVRVIRDYAIVNVQSDGATLVYNRAS